MNAPHARNHAGRSQRLLVAGLTAALLLAPAVMPAHAQQFPTPQAMMAALKAAGQSAPQIAAQLRQAFKQDASQVATLMRGAGFPASVIAGAIQAAFKANARVVAGALKAAGFTLAQVDDVLSPPFSFTEAADALRDAFDISVEQFLQFARARNAAMDDVMTVLRSTYGHNACGAAGCPAANLLRQAGYTASQVARALRVGYQLDAPVVGPIIGTIFGVSGAALQAALQGAGYTAAQVAAAMNAAATTAGTIANAAVTTATTAGANAIDIAAIAHGSHASCSFPGGMIYGLGAGSPPLPLPPGTRQTVTFVGQRLALVTDITGWPAGVRSVIRARTDCYLLVDVTIPRGLRTGSLGQATLRVGQAAGPRFAWTIDRIPPPISPRGPVQAVGGGGGPGAVATNPGGASGAPDLVASFQGPVLRFVEPNSRRISDEFCRNVPASGGEAVIADVVVPNITWGVINSSNDPVNMAFRIELVNGSTGQVLAWATVPPGRLVPGVTSFTQSYTRPRSRTRVVRVTPASSAVVRNEYGPSGCFQVTMAPVDILNWQDPPYRVRVDVMNAVNEGADGEINNEGIY